MTAKIEKISVLIKRILPLVIIGLVFFIVMKMLVASKKQPPKNEATEQYEQVQAAIVQVGEYTPYINIMGQAESPKAQTFSAPVSAYVKKVAVDVGDSVGAGVLLVALDGQDVHINLSGQRSQLAQLDSQISSQNIQNKSNQQLLDNALEQLALAETNLHNSQVLFEQGVGAKNAVDQAQNVVLQNQSTVNARKLAVAQYRQTVAGLEAQKRQINASIQQNALVLKRSIVKSPSPVIVTAVHVAEGERVSIGQPLVSVYAQDDVQIKAQIPQQYVERVKAALQNADNEQYYYAYNADIGTLPLKRLSGTVNASGGVDAYFGLPKGVNIDVGQSVNLKLFFPEKSKVFAVKESAIHAGKYVYLINDFALKAEAINKEGRWQNPETGEIFELVSAPAIAEGDKVLISNIDAVNGQVVDYVLDGAVYKAPRPPLSTVEEHAQKLLTLEQEINGLIDEAVESAKTKESLKKTLRKALDKQQKTYAKSHPQEAMTMIKKGDINTVLEDTTEQERAVHVLSDNADE